MKKKINFTKYVLFLLIVDCLSFLLKKTFKKSKHFLVFAKDFVNIYARLFGKFGLIFVHFAFPNGKKKFIIDPIGDTCLEMHPKDVKYFCPSTIATSRKLFMPVITFL